MFVTSTLGDLMGLPALTMSCTSSLSDGYKYVYKEPNDGSLHLPIIDVASSYLHIKFGLFLLALNGQVP